ncbi:MAG: PAS domain-containing protein [Actinobacteria bacterium]|nr:PAS domain-containing protein [Actinomycetota bacterium]
MDTDMTDKQILTELKELRQRIAELEAAGLLPEKAESHPIESDYFRMLVENAHDLILVLNADGTMRYVSPAAKRLTGYDTEELKSKNPFEFVHPDDLPGIVERFSVGLETPGHTEHVEYRSKRKDGTWFIAEAIATNLLDNPTIQGIVINIRDITAFRRIEDDLRKSEERYRYLVENLNDVVFTIDTQGTLLYISPAIERVTKYKTGDLVGQPFMRFIHPDDLPGLLESFQRTLNGVIEPYEFRVIDKDGGLLYVQTSSRPFEESGQPAGLIGIMTEMTERKNADEARRRSEESFRAMIRKNIHYYRGT